MRNGLIGKVGLNEVKGMRALFVNAVCGIGSTGRICTDTAKELEAEGYEVKIAYGRGRVPSPYKKYAVVIGNKVDVCWHALMTKLFDKRGVCSKAATRRFIKWADEFNPDLLWLHNLHDYFINYEILFEWIKSRPEMVVKWTQHDCWAFTGGCPHFVTYNCDLWKCGCSGCPSERRKKLIRTEAKNYIRKRNAFTGIKNMTIVAVSKWMGNLVLESFLKEYPVEIRYNQINKEIFKPTENDFRRRYGLENKKIVLGVSSVWNKSKGYYDFIKLSEMFDDEIQVVLVGLDKKQIEKLPQSILGIERTSNAAELAGIYTSADVFVNLTYADTYPTVNLEAQACGTPCITYRTGGSPESVPPENVVEQGDIEGIVKRIKELLFEQK